MSVLLAFRIEKLQKRQNNKDNSLFSKRNQYLGFVQLIYWPEKNRNKSSEIKGLLRQLNKVYPKLSFLQEWRKIILKNKSRKQALLIANLGKVKV